MDFIRSDNWDEGKAALSARLIDELTAGKQVLWLLSGGSNTVHSVQIMQTIPAELTHNLTISLIDERYGAVGHADSNFTQLVAAGFDPENATVIPVLVAGLSREQTAERFEQLIEHLLTTSDSIIGQLGMGDDGHIAGILPNTAAAGEHKALVVSYTSHPYQRISLGFAGLLQLDAAYVFAFGEAKATALRNLSQNLPVEQQPAQILKQLSEAYVYNDQQGDN